MKNHPQHMRLVVNREKGHFDIRGVYLVTDQGAHLPERVEQALAGGVCAVQYREKRGDNSRKLQEALAIKQLCSKYGTPLIINDDIALAKEIDADGVHLGQDDGSPVAARELLGPDKIIGVSTHNLEEALRAELEGADYIGFGAMYPTATKEVEHIPGPESLASIRQRITIPMVAIGGISRENACRIIDSGADAIAVISAILSSDTPRVATAELRLLFNRKRPFPRGSVLTIAGSDSGGGAGIQADLKSITLLGSYGSSVITALTAQNTRGVSGIFGIPSSFVLEQLETVMTDIPVDVVKTGMLFSAETVRTVADYFKEHPDKLLVVDPVMLAKGGAHLVDRDAIAAFSESLLPITYLVTPNVPEAERLTGLTITDEHGMEQAARALHKMGPRYVLIKGGHLPSGEATDVLYDGRTFYRYTSQRLLTRNTHGTGCTYASAIATFLAQGEPLRKAIAEAKEFITTAIRNAAPLGKGHGPVNHYIAARELTAKMLPSEK